MIDLNEVSKEQLKCIFRWATWDGDLISKASRDALVKAGLVQCVNGWNIITERGAKLVVENGWVKPNILDPLNFVTSEGACYHDFGKGDCPVEGCVHYGGPEAVRRVEAMFRGAITHLKEIGALDS